MQLNPLRRSKTQANGNLFCPNVGRRTNVWVLSMEYTLSQQDTIELQEQKLVRWIS